MSRTELYIVKKDGKLELYEEFGNSHRGAALLWDNLTKKYLNISHWITMEKKDMEKLWNLDKNFNVPREVRILFISTFDKMMIKKENLSQFIEAIKLVLYLNYFEEIGHFESYPKILEDILEIEDVIAIAWNQTSVCSGVWEVYEECPTCGESSIRRGYNIFKDKDHQFLFEYLDN